MHDQSASRISGRTRAAVSAMGLRALRITVLKSAGNFARDECHDLSAEKIQHVKCFMFTRRNLLRPGNFRTPERRAGFENFRLWSIRGRGGYFALSGLPLKSGHRQFTARISVSCQLGRQAISIEIDCREVMSRGGSDDGVAIHQVKIRLGSSR
jgi:hypothetical protein